MPELKHVEEQIGDLRVHTTQFKPRKAYRLAGQLATLAEQDGGGKSKVTISSMAASAMKLDDLFTECMASTFVTAADGPGGKVVKYDFANPDKIDDAFTGRFKLMGPVLEFVLRVNYADFSDGSGQPDPKADPAIPE